MGDVTYEEFKEEWLEPCSETTSSTVELGNGLRNAF